MNENNDQSYNRPIGGDTENVYKNTGDGKTQNRALSVAALLFGILSIILCTTPWLGGIFGVLALASAIASRKKLGYFDGISVGGLITAIFGLVFVIALTIISAFFIDDIRLFFEQLL
jgi:hypothetical protein